MSHIHGTYCVMYASPSEPGKAEFCHHHHSTMRAAHKCATRIAKAAAWVKAILRPERPTLFTLPARATGIGSDELRQDARARAWAKQA